MGAVARLKISCRREAQLRSSLIETDGMLLLLLVVILVIKAAFIVERCRRIGGISIGKARHSVLDNMRMLPGSGCISDVHCEERDSRTSTGSSRKNILFPVSP